MEVRFPLLHQISQALTAGIKPTAEVGRGNGAGAVEPAGQEPVRMAPPDLQNLATAINTGNTSLLLSPQEIEILDALFVNPSHHSEASGFTLGSSRNPRPAVKGSFVDLRG
ncbi:MAG: hypothetical protein IIA59_10895 [Candidatus Marinimicrobia bacterium]|nr:hypothetical protein [Candidatus Neomarinimicrobiota bacterium]